jgi:transposase
MPRHAPVLDCSAEDKASLIAMSMSRSEEARMVERARIILSRLEGKQLQQIGRDLSISIPTVTKWCKRFSFWGMRGLFDEPRSGKPVKYGAAFRDSVLAVLEQKPPPGMSRWDGPAVAEKLDSSVHAVWRVLQREGIHLQRRRTWCVSKDKEFAVKAADVVGLYLDPPANAVVLSVDEKPSIQAIERSAGYVKIESSGIVRAQQSTYKRHGTVNLFAALDVATGQVMSEITETKTRVDFQSFLGRVIAEQPADKEIHVIVDNYSTHKKTKNG